MNTSQIINTIISIIVFTLLAFLFTILINKHKNLSKKSKIKVVSLTVLFTCIILILMPKFITNQGLIILLYAAVTFVNCLIVSYAVNQKLRN